LIKGQAPARTLLPSTVKEGRFAGFDGVAASLTRVTTEVAKNFSEFAAFDLAMSRADRHAADRCHDAIAATEAADAQIRCALSLARIEPNPGIVSATLGRALPPLVQLLRAERWEPSHTRHHRIARD
jgi:hypothetical protein